MEGEEYSGYHPPPSEEYAAESPEGEPAAYDQDAAIDFDEPAAQMDDPSPQFEVCRTSSTFYQITGTVRAF